MFTEKIVSLDEVRREIESLQEGLGDEGMFINTTEMFEAFEYDEVIPFVYRYNEEYDDYDEEIAETYDEYVDYLEEMGFEEVLFDNSYNWNSPLTNDIDIRAYSNGDCVKVFVKVHRFGDVRCNYTDYFLLEFDYIDGFFEGLFYLLKNEVVEVDGVEYVATSNPLSEEIVVTCDETGEEFYVYGAFFKEDLISEIVRMTE